MPTYDYSEAGTYFITVVLEGRRALFGEVWDGEMRLNRYGAVVERCWNDLVNHYSHVVLDEFVVMPNHFHWRNLAAP